MLRRRFITGAAAAAGSALARPGVAQPAGARVLKFVPAAPLTALDPIWTTAAVTRVHGYLVFDSLYGLDGRLEPQPQMAEGHVAEPDGLAWTISLRPGLKFHDGSPVLARDCAASLRRWMKRSPMGQKLDSVTDELSAPTDRTLRFRLKRPFPLLLTALGSVGPQALVMPERLATSDAFQQVREVVGSGPYRFRPDEFNSGSFAAYERFVDYVPTPVGKAELTAGPKRAHFDRIEWHMIPDAATAGAALQSGEVDWYEQPPPDLLGTFRRNRAIAVEKLDIWPQVGGLRFNCTQPPFDDKRMRQAILPAVDQADFAVSVAGDDPALWQAGVGVFTPGTPSASTAGLEALTGPRSVERAKQLLREAGYAGQPMRQLGATDLPSVAALSQVGADMFRRIGMNNDFALSDWGTVVQRRASREPLERGGWSVFQTTFSWFEFNDPAANVALRGNGDAAYFGWPTMPRVEALREAWFEAPDAAARKRICESIQRAAMDEVPFVPLGAFFFTTAYRRNLADRVVALPVFWNIRRA